MIPEPLAFGVDIGGTKIELNIVNESGVVLAQKRIPTDVQGGASSIIRDIATACKSMNDQSGLKPTATGVGVAGQITAKTGLIRFAPNLRWKDFPLKDELEKHLSIPVAVTNDVRAAAWGEWLFGAGENVEDVVCIFLGTGVGGAVVSGGRMLTGSNNSAGELGHITLEINGPQCTCGHRGCFEAFAGGWAIAKNARAMVENDPMAGKAIFELAQSDLEKVSAREVLKAAAEGDPLAVSIVDEVLEAIAAASIGIVNAFNPSKLIFGGGLGLALPKLVEYVQEQIEHHALKSSSENLQVVAARLGENAGAIGAATYALKMRE